MRSRWLRCRRGTSRRGSGGSFAGGHQADGVAFGRRSIELVEVELTAKRAPRYASIFTALRRRLDYGDASRIAYLCNPQSARAVRVALDASPSGRDIASRVAVRETFDARAALSPGAAPTI